MTPRLRKLGLAAHITSSLGWLGAVVAYLALAIAGLTSHDDQMVRAAYLSMEWIGWFVIVPFSLMALLTGLVQSLGTPWGLFRHYWLLVKFLLTSGATIILLLHMPSVSRMSGMAAEMTAAAWSGATVRALQIQLVVHAGGGLVVVLAAMTLSVYKPWGLTAHGRRKQHERRGVPQAHVPRGLASELEIGIEPERGSSSSKPRWVYVGGIHAIALILLLVVLHLTGGGLRGH